MGCLQFTPWTVLWSSGEQRFFI